MLTNNAEVCSVVLLS